MKEQQTGSKKNILIGAILTIIAGGAYLGGTYVSSNKTAEIFPEFIQSASKFTEENISGLTASDIQYTKGFMTSQATVEWLAPDMQPDDKVMTKHAISHSPFGSDIVTTLEDTQGKREIQKLFLANPSDEPLIVETHVSAFSGATHSDINVSDLSHTAEEGKTTANGITVSFNTDSTRNDMVLKIQQYHFKTPDETVEVKDVEMSGFFKTSTPAETGSGTDSELNIRIPSFSLLAEDASIQIDGLEIQSDSAYLTERDDYTMNYVVSLDGIDMEENDQSLYKGSSHQLNASLIMNSEVIRILKAYQENNDMDEERFMLALLEPSKFKLNDFSADYDFKGHKGTMKVDGEVDFDLPLSSRQQYIELADQLPPEALLMDALNYIKASFTLDADRNLLRDIPIVTMVTPRPSSNGKNNGVINFTYDQGEIFINDQRL